MLPTHPGDVYIAYATEIAVCNYLHAHGTLVRTSMRHLSVYRSWSIDKRGRKLLLIYTSLFTIMVAENKKSKQLNK